jgi:transcriptional regulator GlxA family with amidase domain
MLRALPSLLCPIGNENVESHHEPEGADEQISGGGGLEERSETIIAFQRVLQQNPSRETMVDSIQSRVSVSRRCGDIQEQIRRIDIH